MKRSQMSRLLLLITLGFSRGSIGYYKGLKEFRQGFDKTSPGIRKRFPGGFQQRTLTVSDDFGSKILQCKDGGIVCSSSDSKASSVAIAQYKNSNNVATKIPQSIY